MSVKDKVISVVAKGTSLFNKIPPHALVVGGVVGLVGAGVVACVVTPKFMARKEDYEDTVGLFKEARDELGENGVQQINHVDPNSGENFIIDYTRKDWTAAINKEHLGVVTGTIRIYAPALLLGSVSIAAILGGHHILRKRNAALVGAYKTLDTIYNRYRANVRNEYGEDVDQRMTMIRTVTEKEVTYETKSGKTKTKMEEEISFEFDDSGYSRVFGPNNPNWDGSSPHANMLFLNQTENFLRNKLYLDGVLFLNDVYRQLGFSRTAAGQAVGWTVDNEDMSDFSLGMMVPARTGGVAFPMSDNMQEGVWLNIEPEGVVVESL